MHEFNAQFIPFAAQTPMSGMNRNGKGGPWAHRQIRKEAADAIARYGQSNGGELPATTRAVVDDISKQVDEPLSGPKVRSFYKNLTRDLTYVTNDTWMAQFAGLPADAFKSDGRHLGYTVTVREAAARNGVQPAEAQAAIWSLMSRLSQGVNAVTRGRDVLARLTDEVVGQASNFTDLLENADVRELLGQGQGSASVEGAVEASVAAAKEIRSVDEGSINITPAVRAALGRIADRAEQLARWPVNPEKLADETSNLDDLQYPEVTKPGDDIPFLSCEKLIWKFGTGLLRASLSARSPSS